MHKSPLYWEGLDEGQQLVTQREFDKLLLHDILPTEGIRLAAGETYHVADAYPDSIVAVPLHRDTDPAEMFSVAHQSHAVLEVCSVDRPARVIHIDATSEHMQMLDDTPWGRLANLQKVLQDGYQALPVEHCNVAMLLPKNADDPVEAPPNGFLLMIEEKKFHDMAVELLKKITDPMEGFYLMENRDPETYQEQLRSPDSHESRLIAKIIANAGGLNADEQREIEEAATQAGNEAFADRVRQTCSSIPLSYAAKVGRGSGNGQSNGRDRP